MGDAERRESAPTRIERHFRLVRSKIPEIIAARGEQAEWYPLSSKDTLYHLMRSDGKLQEEVRELVKAETPEEVANEAADVIQAVLGIAYHWGISKEEIERLRMKKQEERGDFKTGVYLVSSGPPEAYEELARHVQQVAHELELANQQRK